MSVDFCHELRRLRDRARQREAARQHVVLAIAARGIAKDAKADVANDVRIDCTVLAPTSEAKKSVVQAETAFIGGIGQLVANRTPKAGRDAVSAATRIFMPIARSSTSDVESPVTVSMFASGAGSRSVMASRLNKPPSIWISAIELTPMLTPTSGTRSRLPSRPDAR